MEQNNLRYNDDVGDIVSGAPFIVDMLQEGIVVPHPPRYLLFYFCCVECDWVCVVERIEIKEQQIRNPHI